MASLAPHFDGFLLDQWGVLHDGVRPYAGAVEALAALRSAGKAILILSNSGRRGPENEILLSRIGFSRSLYDAVISAGDDARDALLDRNDPFHAALGPRCFLFCREGEDHLVDGLGLTLVSDIDQADFLFALSMDPPRQSIAGWKKILDRAAERRLPMICGNPDIVRVSPDGILLEAPGAIARAYEELGGAVRYHGKPHGRIYDTCLRLLDLPRDRVAAIGDSLHHDVAGAAGCGLDSILVAGGIHRGELAWGPQGVDPESCSLLFARTGFAPQYVVPSFIW
ncbi:TIGR01459 family HAD-type hydrolase [Microvirga alba]|uniref:TIGR01459 family HAD-type hydrolase n=1 Tax=Microvirga alba TaxID=2791025 RepID=A0A931BM72_9HYPH|nr:TIGR01459 family HAD-type hydrolase [Microvirga alba]MBF9231900.1 TIGR01459 family HAD-type hydrolase [Microvirga alba]